MDAWFIGDLKIHNKTLGLQEHSAAHPCEYCDAEKKNLRCDSYTLRAFGMIRANNREWIESKSKKADLSRFQNCIEQPIFEDVDDAARIMELYPPPELHLMTGVFNYLVKLLEKTEPDAANAWLRNNHGCVTYVDDI